VREREGTSSNVKAAPVDFSASLRALNQEIEWFKIERLSDRIHSARLELARAHQAAKAVRLSERENHPGSPVERIVEVDAQ
jgi:hypothetical protein